MKHLEEILSKSFVYEAREDWFYDEPGYNDHFRNTVCNFEVNKKHPCENSTETLINIWPVMLYNKFTDVQQTQFSGAKHMLSDLDIIEKTIILTFHI